MSASSFLRAGAVAWLATTASAPWAFADLPPLDLIVENVTIHDGNGGEPFVGTVVAREGKFAVVMRGRLRDAEPARPIDGAGKHLMPGIWDMHAHVRASEAGGLDAKAFVAHGVTSIRDLGARIERIRALEREIADGAPGPSIYSSLTTLNGKAFGPFQRAVTSESEAARAIDDLVKAGAVQIKVHRALSAELLPAVLRIAHEQGLTVTGHIPPGLHPLKACELGMDGIEHAASFIEAYVSVTPGATAEAAFGYLLSDAAAPLYRCLARRGVEVTPTLVIYPAVARSRAKGGALPEGAVQFIDGVKRIALKLHQAGVTLLSGTDTSDVGDLAIAPGVSLLDELEMLQEAGIPARDLIPIATMNAARTLGLAARTGSIAAGKDADFVLLAADPSRDIGALRRPLAVYRVGKLVAGDPFDSPR